MAEENQSAHPNALPNYQKAVIPPDKLRKYALDPTSADGKGKAKGFKNRLGFDLSNWELLQHSILNRLPYHEAILRNEDEHGKRYTVFLLITGPNGKTEEIVTGWIIKPETDYPCLATTYFRKRKR